MNQNPEPSTSSSSSAQSRQGGDASRGARSGGGSQGRDLASEARQVADDLAEQATQTAERQFTGTKDRAVEAMSQLAGALRQTTGRLSSESDIPAVGEYLGRAASQVEGLSDYLQQKSMRDVVEDVEQFARREPVLFLGGAFLVGLLGGRFLKSAAPSTATGRGTKGPGARNGR